MFYHTLQIEQTPQKHTIWWWSPVGSLRTIIHLESQFQLITSAHSFLISIGPKPTKLISNGSILCRCTKWNTWNFSLKVLLARTIKTLSINSNTIKCQTKTTLLSQGCRMIWTTTVTSFQIRRSTYRNQTEIMGFLVLTFTTLNKSVFSLGMFTKPSNQLFKLW